MTIFGVVAAVGICWATLLFLRPHLQNRGANAIVSAHGSDAIVSARDVIASARDDARAGPILQPDGTPTGPDWPRPTLRTDSLTDAVPPVAPPSETPPETVAAASQDVPANDASQPEPKQVVAENDSIADKIAELSPANTGSSAPVQPDVPPKSGPKLTKAEVDDALKPLLTYDLSSDDSKNLKEIVRLVQKDDYSAAHPLIAKLRDTGAKSLALWYYYRSGATDTTADEISEFRDSNPLWPDRDELEDRAEEALFWREANPKKIVAFFQERRPISGPGKAALGGALIATGKADEGKALIRTAWREHYLTPAIEAKLKDKFPDVLRPEDHKARLDWLLIKNRKSDLKAIDRLVPLVDKKWEPAVKAQIALIKGEKSAGRCSASSMAI